MIREGMTISDATHRWVAEFNAIPQGMIAKLMKNDLDEWWEVTTPATGDSVYVFKDGRYGEINEYLEEDDVYQIELDDGTVVEAEAEDFEVLYDDGLPMWGTMWSFGDNLDDYWLTEMNGIRIMSECGFRIYESEEFGYFFGIDGCGYDFYEEHWCKLYKARGLKWHDPKTEKEVA